MRRGRLPILLLILACLAGPLAGRAWPWRRTFRGIPTALALDGAGDALVGASLPGIFFLPKIEIAKLARADGRRLWRYRGGFGAPAALALDPAGDVLAAGYSRMGGFAPPPWFAVIKLDGAAGTERWRVALPDGGARAVASDAQGAVVAGGALGGHFAVVKLAAPTGATIWMDQLGSGEADAVIVDAAGDVLVAGAVDGAFAVARLTGDAGAERWRVTVPGGAARALARDPAGDVFAAGSLGDDLLVVRLAGGTGGKVWRTVIAGAGAAALARDPAGDVIVAGTFTAGGGRHLAVAKLAGANGVERWRQMLGDGSETDGATAVAVGAGGDVTATGRVSRTGRRPALATFATVTLAGASGDLRHWLVVDGTGRGPAGDVGKAVAVDATGRVTAVGSITRRVRGVDETHVVVVRLPAR